MICSSIEGEPSLCFLSIINSYVIDFIQWAICLPSPSQTFPQLYSFILWRFFHATVILLLAPGVSGSGLLNKIAFDVKCFKTYQSWLNFCSIRHCILHLYSGSGLPKIFPCRKKTFVQYISSSHSTANIKACVNPPPSLPSFSVSSHVQLKALSLWRESGFPLWAQSCTEANIRGKKCDIYTKHQVFSHNTTAFGFYGRLQEEGLLSWYILRRISKLESRNFTHHFNYYWSKLESVEKTCQSQDDVLLTIPCSSSEVMLKELFFANISV